MNETNELHAALRRLFAAGERLVIEAGARSLRASGSDLADQLTCRPEFAATVTAADRAALANGYAIQKPEAAKTTPAMRVESQCKRTAESPTGCDVDPPADGRLMPGVGYPEIHRVRELGIQMVRPGTPIRADTAAVLCQSLPVRVIHRGVDGCTPQVTVAGVRTVGRVVAS